MLQQLLVQSTCSERRRVARPRGAPPAAAPAHPLPWSLHLHPSPAAAPGGSGHHAPAARDSVGAAGGHQHLPARVSPPRRPDQRASLLRPRLLLPPGVPSRGHVCTERPQTLTGCAAGRQNSSPAGRSHSACSACTRSPATRAALLLQIPWLPAASRQPAAGSSSCRRYSSSCRRCSCSRTRTRSVQPARLQQARCRQRHDGRRRRQQQRLRGSSTP